MVRIIESREDQLKFIDKFGQDTFNTFTKNKSRIANKGISTDIIYHWKNTSISDMNKILNSVSDEQREQELDIEGKQIPKDTKNYNVIAEDDDWIVYQPLDYISSIYLADGARWCTAGGYNVPYGKIKVSQAKQYFNDYIGNKGVTLYYFVNKHNKNKKYGYTVYPDGEIQVFNYNDRIVKLETIPHKVGAKIFVEDFVIKDGILKDYKGNDKEVIIPDGVTSIGNFAFSNCKSITSITIPDSVTSIENWAFSSCTNLRSIIIPDGVVSIGRDAFAGCTSLISITIPDSLIDIGRNAFYNCNSLTSITIPDGVTSIGKGAFAECKNLTSVTLPDSITIIGSNTFQSCTSLTSITIPDSVTDIWDRAFYYCTSLKSITIPDGVTSIGTGAFVGCKNLTSVTIPDSIIIIGYNAFLDCNHLSKIYYQGNEDQWDEIEIGVGNENLLDAELNL